MGARAKAILFGHVTASQIEAALNRSRFETSILSPRPEITSISARPIGGGGDYMNVLQVFGREISQTSGAHVYDGERTVCSSGATGNGPAVCRILAQEFGGFHIADDGMDDDVEAWTAEKGSNELDLTPAEAMRVAFQHAIPGAATSETFAAMEADPDRLAGLRDAITRYLDTLAASPGPAR